LNLQEVVEPAPQLLRLPTWQLRVSFDPEADVLYLNFKKPSYADDSELTDDDIIVRYEQGEVVGVTILYASQHLYKQWARRSNVRGRVAELRLPDVQGVRYRRAPVARVPRGVLPSLSSTNPCFASRVTTFGVAAFGRISSTVLTPREIRLGLRLTFSWLHRPEACEAFAAPKLLA
jgi:uncharacterized protein YuzE